MPTYVFENKKGERIERAFSMHEAPRTIRVNRKIYRRIIVLDDFRARTYVKPTVHNLVSRALPLKWPYAKKWDQKGQPVFEGRKDIREAVANANDHGEHVTYDD